MACLSRAGDVDRYRGTVNLDDLGLGVHGQIQTPQDAQDRVGAPLEGEFRRLPVDQIAPFDAGPRLLRNPKWAAIKASIKASGGLTNTLSVTKRPGSAHYVCHQGGNTRLLALKELHQETSDPRFGEVRVEVMPYTSDFDLALLHDRENTCRGDLTFIEDAWSKYRLYQMYCRTTRAKTTARSFVNHMRDEQGVVLTVESFSRIKYTVEVLYQHIPTCLVQGGMSIRAVRRLITLRNGLKKAWTARSIGTVAHFDETFYGLLARQDQDLAATYACDDDSVSDQFPDPRITIDWTLFQQEFQHEFSVYSGVSYQKAGAWIAAAFRRIEKPNAIPSVSKTADTTTVIQASPNAHELRVATYQDACRIAAAGELEHLVEPSDDGFGYRVTGKAPLSASPISKACWWALVLATSPDDEVARCTRLMGEAPSFMALPADALTWMSALFANHARIVRKGT